ncbi:ATP-grasp domain-containing protein [Kribbella catacumbae]|uniref:ATP-grasp domain-containing protein n=1 Tax=Kribbella catacumbae TaxID=460086 RepID=UPI000363B512|nr:ATP-grasp domain-containing protein [Kribbella catacumbae]
MADRASLVLIGPSANIVRVARKLDVDLIIVDHTARDLTSLLRPLRDQFFLFDYRQYLPPELARFGQLLQATVHPSAVVSMTEQGLVCAAELSELLGTPGTPPTVVNAMRDKAAMRAVLAQSAPRLTVATASGDDRAAVGRLLGAHGSVIVKPPLGTASDGVRRVRSLDEFDRLDPGLRRGALVEAYAEGVEVSVESLSEEGKHAVVLIVEKRLGENFVEIGHVTPSPSLSEQQCDRVRQAVTDLLDALDYRDGPAHSELIVQGEEIVVVETHNRPGGDGIADLVSATTGLDWRLACLGWPLGRQPQPDEVRSEAAAIVFFTASPGVVTSLETAPPSMPEVAWDYWTVTPQIGDVVGPLLSSAHRLGSGRMIGSRQAVTMTFEQVLAAPAITTESP